MPLIQWFKSNMSEGRIFTYQTRISLKPGQSEILDAYAGLYGRAERSLFAAIQAGGAINDLKRAFQPRFGISARQFNAMRVGLDGKIDSIKKRRPEMITEMQTRIQKAAKVIAKLENKTPGTNKVHQKKRRHANLHGRLTKLKTDHQDGVVRLCFGGKKLFNAQFNLAANGYASHQEWKAEWMRARSSQFFVLGSQDETAGNQSCQAVMTPEGEMNLQVRLPNALSDEHGKHTVLTGLRFAYGHTTIDAALRSSQRVRSQTRDGKVTVKRVGTALSYRFVRDDKGWRVFVSVEAKPVKQVTSKLLGAIGVDVNANHLAVVETDRFGNISDIGRIALVTYGKTTDQAKALIGDAAAKIVLQAKAAGKPIVVEDLNFQKKKAELENVSAKQARLLSSFFCNQVLSAIASAAFRAGVEVITVNPAYTSVIGAINFAQEKGISVHQGAAFAIARRGLRLSERPTVREALAPARNGGHVTFVLPVRNRTKHVWSFWSKARTSLKAAHVAQFRCGGPKGAPPPLSPARLRVRPIWNVTVQFRSANRSQHCSESVCQDIPY